MKKKTKNFKLIIMFVLVTSLLVTNSFVFAKRNNEDNRVKALFMGVDNNVTNVIPDVNVSTADLNNAGDVNKISNNDDNQYTVIKASAMKNKSKLSTQAKNKAKKDYQNGKVITFFGDNDELGDGSALYEYLGEKVGATISTEANDDKANKRHGKLAAITIYKDSNDRPSFNALYIFNDGLELSNKIKELEPKVKRMEKNNISSDKIKAFVAEQIKGVSQIQKPTTDEEKCKEITQNYIRLKTSVKSIANSQPSGVTTQQLAIDSEPPTYTVTVVDSGWGSFVEQIGGKRVFESGNTKRWAVIGSVQVTPYWSSNNVLTSEVHPYFGNWNVNGSFDGQAIWGAFPMITPDNAGTQSYTFNLSASGSLSGGAAKPAEYSGGVSGGISWTTSFNNIDVSLVSNSKGQNFQNYCEWKYNYTLASPSFLNPYFFPASGAKSTSDVSPSIILENTQSKNARCQFGERIVWYKVMSAVYQYTRSADFGYTHYTLPRP